MLFARKKVSFIWFTIFTQIYDFGISKMEVSQHQLPWQVIKLSIHHLPEISMGNKKDRFIIMCMLVLLILLILFLALNNFSLTGNFFIKLLK